MSNGNLKRRPNSVLHTLIYNTDNVRCLHCGNVVLMNKAERPGAEIKKDEQFLCVMCYEVLGWSQVHLGPEQTPEEFDVMLDAITVKMGLDA